MRARIQKFFCPPTSASTKSVGRSKLIAPLRVNAPLESRKLNCPCTPETPMGEVRPSSAHMRPFQYSKFNARSGLPSVVPTPERSEEHTSELQSQSNLV